MARIIYFVKALSIGLLRRRCRRNGSRIYGHYPPVALQLFVLLPTFEQRSVILDMCRCPPLVDAGLCTYYIGANATAAKLSGSDSWHD